LSAASLLLRFCLSSRRNQSIQISEAIIMVIWNTLRPPIATRLARYEGKLYKAPKQKVKRNPQEIWNDVVEAAAADASSAPQKIQHIVSNLASYGNGKTSLLRLPSLLAFKKKTSIDLSS